MVSLEGILLTVLWSSVLSVSGTLVKPRLYEVRNVSSTCTSQTMKIRLELNRNFQGVVYAKGFPLEKQCRSLGTGSTSVEISIDTSGCGVRLVSIDDQRFTFKVNLNIQTDKFLQQINDLEISAMCSLSFNDMVYPKQVVYWPVRTGRNQDDKKQDEGISKIKTWMEIEGTSDSNTVNKVAVGEETMVLIKSFLPETLAAKVTDCYAYDGTKDVAQKLIDEHGCPIDETIMPSLEIIKFEDETFTRENEIAWDAGTDSSVRKKKPPKASVKTEDGSEEDSQAIPEARNKEKGRLQIVGTMFSAFKFPDTSNLHLRCSLEICKKICPAVSCEPNFDGRDRMGKTLKSDRNASSVIDKIEVYNSVEVVAPGIDSDGYASNQDGIASIVQGDGNNFCLSASKMAFSFAILGAVFLCGVLAALWTVMRNHLRKVNKMDGSEQILVVRDSPMNFINPRSKMYHSWTYS